MSDHVQASPGSGASSASTLPSIKPYGLIGGVVHLVVVGQPERFEIHQEVVLVLRGVVRRTWLRGKPITSGANDKFFAPAQNLINPAAADHDPAAFDIRGKVYDGWENIDTAFFRGNFPPFASVEGTALFGYPNADELIAADWQPLVPRTELEGNSANVIAVPVPDRLVTHLRLSIEPDGGVARLRASAG